MFQMNDAARSGRPADRRSGEDEIEKTSLIEQALPTVGPHFRIFKLTLYGYLKASIIV